MFTPQSQRKGWAGWALSPRGGGKGSAARSGAAGPLGKGKAVVEAPPPPPQVLLGEGGGGGDPGGDPEVWRSFRDAGFLDEASLQRKEKEAMAHRISELEKELHGYQYNMGLLLIEKKEWSSKFEQIKCALEESEEILKREQSAHLIAISELEKREENMRKALGVEKQCVVDLEKALRDMRAEVAEVKFTSDKKLVEAHALEASLAERDLEIQSKLHSADAKLAEANRKSSEADRNLQDAEDWGRKLEREYLLFDTQRKTHEEDCAKQKEHLREWEKNLQEGQRRLLEGQSSLNEREQRANGLERDLKKREKTLDEVQAKIEFTSNSLKEKEDDISRRLRQLSAKEKEASILQVNLEKKEKDLRELEERLNAREREEMQKLLDDHNAKLSLKKQEFEFELEEKRRSFDVEVKSKLDAVEKDKNEIKCKEEQLLIREKMLDDKMEKLQEKEKDIEIKLKALNDREKSLKDEEKKLDGQKKQIATEYQKLLDSKAELESLQTSIEAKNQEAIKEKNNLKITKEERDQYLSMQSQLRKEIEDYRVMKESVAHQIDELRQERERFEMEWEVMDEKRKGLEIELNHINDERGKFETWQKSEEERLMNERQMARVNVERELEDLRLKKEAFENLMVHERSQALELLKREHADMSRNFDLHKHELDINIQKKQEEMEKKLQEKEDEFIKRRDLEISNIRSSSNLNESKARKLKVEAERLENEKEKIFASRQKLETDQLEIQRDIDTLRILSRNLKHQREELVKEKEHFLAIIEQCKTCKNCGVALSELELLGLEPLKAVDDAENALLPRLADGFCEEHMQGWNTERSPQGTGSQSIASGGRMSWLRKCTRLFNLSPGKRTEPSPEGRAEKSILFGERLDGEALEGEAEYEAEPSFGVANDSFDMEQPQSDCGLEMNEKSERFVKDGDEAEPSFGVADNSIDILRIQTDNGFVEREGEPTVPAVIEQLEKGASSLPPKSDSQPQALKGRRHQPSRKGRPKVIKRTRSVKAVVEDAKAILGETPEDNKDGQPNGDANHEESLGDSMHVGQVATSSRQRKRPAHESGITASEPDAEDSETRSESVSLGGRRKRRQTTAPGAQTPGEKRYNLRRSTVTGTAAASQATSNQSKGPKVGSHQLLQPEDMIPKSDGDGEGTSKHAATNEPSYGFAGGSEKSAQLQQKMTVGSVLEIHDVPSQKIVQLESWKALPESIDNIVVKSVEFSEQSAEDGEEVDRAEREATSPATPSGGESDSEGDDCENDEDEQKLNASIGKKLWTFFTT